MAREVMRDRQTSGKVDRLRREVHEYENELRACKKAIELIAAHVGLEVDLTPVPSDKEIQDAAELLAHPHLIMPTVAEVKASAGRSVEKAKNRIIEQKTILFRDRAEQPPR